jgi:uncharacterized protein YyaL (SSP411 family)
VALEPFPVQRCSGKEISVANHLGDETSPYLLQHVDNPVDWHPWGDDALELAKQENKPILLSIGYAACHWCHVMAHESFEDDQTALLMNEHFINIKVDREERPDLDSIYMSAVTAMTGHGGWPMTVFLTPQGRPFYSGTYFPKEPRYGMPSFRQILLGVADAWKNQQDKVQEGAEQITEHVQQTAGVSAPVDVLDTDILTSAVNDLKQRFDSTWGGFGQAPKFPQPMVIEFLLRERLRGGDDQALGMAELTLQRMAQRKDAVRQRTARENLSPCMAVHRQTALSPNRRGDPRLRVPRDASRGRRLLQQSGCRQ